MPLQDTLVARRLAPNWRVLCASPSYIALHGEPKSVADLEHHDFIVLVTKAGALNELHFEKNEIRQRYLIPMDRSWETNDSALARKWVLEGKGLARKTVWDAVDDIRAGRLKVVLPDHCIPEAGVQAVFHSTRYMAPRVRALLDFLIERFQQATDQLLLDLQPISTERRTVE